MAVLESKWKNIQLTSNTIYPSFTQHIDMPTNCRNVTITYVIHVII